MDDSIDMDPPVSTWNKFPMGDTTTFKIGVDISSPYSFNAYLTMGYGTSAEGTDRRNPKYYNPEFNRKAAWKVDVDAPTGNSKGTTWDINDEFPQDVVVSVYDWQIGAVVSTAPDFGDALESEIYSASDPSQVTVEVLGMSATLPAAASPDDPLATGRPDDPWVYTVPVPHDAEPPLPAGTYPGLVAVTDSRIPAGEPPAAEYDYLMDSKDGSVFKGYAIPGFVTYQTFTANVVGDCSNQSLLWNFNECTTPAYSCDGWICGGCDLKNTDIFGWGSFTFGCVASNSCTYAGTLTSGGDSHTPDCAYLNDHWNDAEFNVVSPSITLPIADDSEIEFNHCNAFAPDATAYLYISLNGCTGPWEEIWSTITADECVSDETVDISSYSGTDVMFRFQYVSINYTADGGSCGNAGILIDDVEISGCFDGKLEVN